MVDDPLEGWQLLEEIFWIQAVSSDQWFLWTDVYLCPVLDFPVRDGPCLLSFASIARFHALAFFVNITVNWHFDFQSIN